MNFKSLTYIFLFLLLVACETGVKEEEKPNELKKEINERFLFKKQWSANVFKNPPLGKIKISFDEENIYVFDSRGEIKSYSYDGKKNWTINRKWGISA